MTIVHQAQERVRGGSGAPVKRNETKVAQLRDPLGSEPSLEPDSVSNENPSSRSLNP